jgi:hypothetical protein
MMKSGHQIFLIFEFYSEKIGVKMRQMPVPSHFVTPQKPNHDDVVWYFFFSRSSFIVFHVRSESFVFYFFIFSSIDPLSICLVPSLALKMKSISSNDGNSANQSSSVRNRVGNDSDPDQSSKFHFYSSSDLHQEQQHKSRGIFSNNYNAKPNITNRSLPSEGNTGGGFSIPKLGTMNGVLLPTLQSTLNVILFLRLPSITAQAGCVYTTFIILICVASTLITAISLSAIATNGTIQAGGPYYVISRTLGLEAGGALGLLYYLGSTMACAMSALGAVEAILRSVGDSLDNQSGPTVITLLDPANNNDPFMNIDNSIEQSTRRFLQSEYDVAMVDPISLGPNNMIEEEIITEIGAEMNHQHENNILVQVGTQYLSLMLVLMLTLVSNVGFRVVDMASNVFLAIMFLSIFCSVLGCILFATGYHIGDLIPWDRRFMDNVWPNFTPDPITGIEPNFFSSLALFYPSVTGKF